MCIHFKVIVGVICLKLLQLLCALWCTASGLATPLVAAAADVASC